VGETVYMAAVLGLSIGWDRVPIVIVCSDK